MIHAVLKLLKGSLTANEKEELFLCRIYEKTEPYFTSPCDSRLIGVHKATSQWATMKVLSSLKLTKQAMIVDLGCGKKLFMVILHTKN